MPGPGRGKLTPRNSSAAVPGAIPSPRSGNLWDRLASNCEGKMPLRQAQGRLSRQPAGCRRYSYNPPPWRVLQRRIVLAGESPARVSAGAPGSRLRSRGEIRAARRSVKSSCKREEQTSGLQQSVNAIASTNYQPKGVWGSRAAHVTAKATDSILGRNECWILPGVSGGGTLRENNAEQERPYLAA
jgi:hypothetical protein